MNEKLNNNAKVEKFTNMLGIAVHLIVIDPSAWWLHPNLGDTCIRRKYRDVNDYVLALDYTPIAVSEKVGPEKPVNHISLVTELNSTDLHKSVRKCCYIELFSGVFVFSHPVFYRDLVYKLRRVKDARNFFSSGSKIVKCLRRRHYDPVIIERTIGLVLGPSTALYEPFLKHCTLTNKAVGTIWRALSKPPQRRHGPDLCPLWLLVGTPSAIRPELAFSRAEHSRSYSDVAKYIFDM